LLYLTIATLNGVFIKNRLHLTLFYRKTEYSKLHTGCNEQFPIGMFFQLERSASAHVVRRTGGPRGDP